MFFQKGDEGEIRIIAGTNHPYKVIYRKDIEERIKELENGISDRLAICGNYSSLNVDRLKKLIKAGKMILKYSSLEGIAKSLHVSRATAMCYTRCLIK